MSLSWSWSWYHDHYHDSVLKGVPFSIRRHNDISALIMIITIPVHYRLDNLQPHRGPLKWERREDGHRCSSAESHNTTTWPPAKQMFLAEVLVQSRHGILELPGNLRQETTWEWQRRVDDVRGTSTVHYDQTNSVEGLSAIRQFHMLIISLVRQQCAFVKSHPAFQHLNPLKPVWALQGTKGDISRGGVRKFWIN